MKNKPDNSNGSTQDAKHIDLRTVLFIFDIDGTMMDTKSVDDQCFIETLEELYGFDLSEKNWSNFEHVTDAGLTYEIYKNYKGHQISKSQLKKVQRLFFRKLSDALLKNPERMKPIQGIHDFLEELRHRQISMAIATGGWRKSAEQKLKAANILYNGFTLATSNDSHKRRTIMNVAIARAQFEYQRKFSKVIYFGDGNWDAHTCDAMNIPMIGIDYHKSGELSQTNVKYIFNDFTDSISIFKAIEQIFLTHE